MATVSVAQGRQRIQNLFDSKPLIMVGAVVIVGFLALTPLIVLLWGSFWTSGPGRPGVLTLANYILAYSSLETYLLLRNTVYYAVGASVVALVLGGTMAWLIERTNMPFRGLAYVLALTPLFIPGVLNSIAWQLLFSPTIGFINTLAKGLFRLEQSPFNIYSLLGMIWLEGLGLSTLVFVLLSATLRVMDPSLEEAAVMSGAGLFSTLRRVTLRLMLPSILSVMLIALIRGLESFEIPALIGIPGGVVVLTSKIFLAIREHPQQFGLATALGMTLMAASVIGVYSYSRMTRRAERFVTVTGKGFRPKVIDLGAGRYVALAFVVGLFILAVALPVSMLVWGSLLPYYSPPAVGRLSEISLKNYAFALSYGAVGRAIGNSLTVAVVSATAAMLLTSIIAWIVVRTRMRGRQLLDVVTFLPVSFPGIVLALALLWVFLTLPIGLYGTIWVLVLAYVTRFMPYGIRASSGSLIQIHKELEEVAETSGASWLQTFRRVTVPLLAPGLIAGWIYIALLSTRELATSVLLYGPGSEVLPVVIFDMWESGATPYVCALGVMMVVALGTLVAVFRRVGGRISL